MSTGKTERAPKLADVAEAAGVSQGTVSNVFNRPDIVRPEVRDKVHAAATRLGYSGPDPRGRMLRAGKANAIGVATTESLSYFFDDPYARSLLGRIAHHAEASGSGISLISTRSRELLSWNIDSALVDGLILLCLTGNEELISRARERGLPSVALSIGDDKPNLPVIDVDNLAGGKLAVEYLADLGHRRFAILAIEFRTGSSGWRTRKEIEAAEYFTSRDRAIGSLEALAARGIDPASVPVFETSNEIGCLNAALAELFARSEPPTAIITQSDHLAIAALDWFAANGISVPEDVSIIGFDGVPETARTNPPLTTMVQPIDDIARRAVNAILEPPGNDTREVLAATLMVRGSTAPPPRSR